MRLIKLCAGTRLGPDYWAKCKKARENYKKSQTFCLSLLSKI